MTTRFMGIVIIWLVCGLVVASQLTQAAPNMGALLAALAAAIVAPCLWLAVCPSDNPN